MSDRGLACISAWHGCLCVRLCNRRLQATHSLCTRCRAPIRSTHPRADWYAERIVGVGISIRHVLVLVRMRGACCATWMKPMPTTLPHIGNLAYVILYFYSWCMLRVLARPTGPLQNRFPRPRPPLFESYSWCVCFATRANAGHYSVTLVFPVHPVALALFGKL